MKYTDAQLEDAAAFLREAYCASLPDISDYQPNYSQVFLQKMERLCHKYRLTKRVMAFSKNAIAAVITLVLLCSTWLAFNVEARAAFTEWIRETYENSIIYYYFNDTSIDELQNYDITGFNEVVTLLAEEKTETAHIKLYEIGNEVVTLIYYRMGSDTVQQVENAVRIPTTVGCFTADYYLSDSGLANELIWLDENEKITFTLSAHFTQEEMIDLAEHVKATK